jgi:hypothetical protein
MPDDLDNLLVVNWSVSFSLGAVNSSLTAIMSAVTAGDDVPERLA